MLILTYKHNLISCTLYFKKFDIDLWLLAIDSFVQTSFLDFFFKLFF